MRELYGLTYLLTDEFAKFQFIGATLIPHVTKITTQRQSVWENLYALIFYQKMEENTWKKQM